MKNNNYANVKALMIGIAVWLSISSHVARAEFVFGEPTPIGPPVNVNQSEYGASISADGLELYFDTWQSGRTNLSVATRDTTDDDWGEAVLLGPAVNSSAFEWTPRISSDGLELYFASNRNGNTYSRFDIYVARRQGKGDAWQPAEDLGSVINSSNEQTMGSISANGLELYYGTGNSYSAGNELRVATRATKDSAWTETKALAPTIRGIYPAISPGGLHLVFSSESLPGGLGGADLWMMTRATIQHEWSAPVNLGSPINTGGTEYIPWILHDCSAIIYTFGGVGGDVWLVPILSGGDFSMQLEQAQNPFPENNITDWPNHATILSWDPGRFAESHDLYWGLSMDEVESATVDSSAYLGRQLETSYALEGLTFGQAYYWRVDEVNAAPENTVFKGEVWGFTAEPYSSQIPSSSMTATASSFNDDATDPSYTIDGSGLSIDPDDNVEKHSNSTTNVMWTSASPDMAPWLMYEFNTTQKLHQMRIWNCSHASESVIGWGIKDVEIQISMDGVDWTAIPDTGQITRGSGFFPSEAQIIDMGLTAAKYVKLTILNNWGGLVPQYSVAEVQFYSLPMLARTPIPESGSVDVHPNSVVSWRAGREASEHTVYVSTDMNALADGTASSTSSSTSSLDLISLDLQLGETYYWRVDEVNDAEIPSVWTGSVWSLSTPNALRVEDFESYSNISPDRPFQTWLDGSGYSPGDFLPGGYEGNGTGSRVGHDIWSVASPHFNGDIMEMAIAKSGDQSMPFYYSNTGDIASQIDRHWSISQDWSAHGIQTLVLYFCGVAGNTGQLYAKINNIKIPYDGAATDLEKNIWNGWHIDLSSHAITSVNALSIGVEGVGANGMLLLDDIGLYKSSPELPASEGR